MNVLNPNQNGEERDGQFLIEENSALNAQKVEGYGTRGTEERHVYSRYERFANIMIKAIDQFRAGRFDNAAIRSHLIYMLFNPQDLGQTNDDLYGPLDPEVCTSILKELIEARGGSIEGIKEQILQNEVFAKQIEDIQRRTGAVLDEIKEPDYEEVVQNTPIMKKYVEQKAQIGGKREYESMVIFARRMIKGIDAVRTGDLDSTNAFQLALVLSEPNSFQHFSTLYHGLDTEDSNQLIKELLEARGLTLEELKEKMMKNEQLAAQFEKL